MHNSKKYRVVKTVIKTGCDLEREVIKSNLPKDKAEALKAVMDAQEDGVDFSPHFITSYLIEPAA